MNRAPNPSLWWDNPLSSPIDDLIAWSMYVKDHYREDYNQVNDDRYWSYRDWDYRRPVSDIPTIPPATIGFNFTQEDVDQPPRHTDEYERWVRDQADMPLGTTKERQAWHRHQMQAQMYFPEHYDDYYNTTERGNITMASMYDFSSIPTADQQRKAQWTSAVSVAAGPMVQNAMGLADREQAALKAEIKFNQSQFTSLIKSNEDKTATNVILKQQQENQRRTIREMQDTIRKLEKQVEVKDISEYQKLMDRNQNQKTEIERLRTVVTKEANVYRDKLQDYKNGNRIDKETINKQSNTNTHLSYELEGLRAANRKAVDGAKTDYITISGLRDDLLKREANIKLKQERIGYLERALDDVRRSAAGASGYPRYNNQTYSNMQQYVTQEEYYHLRHDLDIEQTKHQATKDALKISLKAQTDETKSHNANFSYYTEQWRAQRELLNAKVGSLECEQTKLHKTINALRDAARLAWANTSTNI
jgi:hypothetical protein